MKSLWAAAAADWQRGHDGATSAARGASGDGQSPLLLLHLERSALTPAIYHMAAPRK